MPDSNDRELFAKLAVELQQSDTETQAADTVIVRALELIPDADLVSVTVRTRRQRLRTLASSNPLAAELDDLQYALREGPCVDAANDDVEWLRSGGVGTDGRWPRWGREAAARGVGSMLSIKLLSKERPLGALNMYSRATGAFHVRGEVDFAVVYAAHSAVALTASRQLDGLETALHSRHVIGVAQGVLMERLGLDLDQSFAVLRRLSNTKNIPVSDLAAQIAETRQLPS